MHLELVRNTNKMSGNIGLSLGSRVQFSTIAQKPGESVVGEVIGFDFPTKTLATRCIHRGQGDKKYVTIRLTNLDYVSTFEAKEPEKPYQLVPMVTANKAEERIKINTEHRRKRIVQSHVSPEGQRLMDFISKTFSDVKWDGDKLIVMDSVVIQPPYKVGDVLQLPTSHSDSRAVDHIKKVVEKFNCAGQDVDKPEALMSTSISPTFTY